MTNRFLSNLEQQYAQTAKVCRDFEQASRSRAASFPPVDLAATRETCWRSDHKLACAKDPAVGTRA
jgi:hypothetical protein